MIQTNKQAMAIEYFNRAVVIMVHEHGDNHIDVAVPGGPLPLKAKVMLQESIQISYYNCIYLSSNFTIF